MVRNVKVLKIQISHSHICAQKKGQQKKPIYLFTKAVPNSGIETNLLNTERVE